MPRAPLTTIRFSAKNTEADTKPIYFTNIENLANFLGTTKTTINVKFKNSETKTSFVMMARNHPVEYKVEKFPRMKLTITIPNPLFDADAEIYVRESRSQEYIDEMKKESGVI